MSERGTESMPGRQRSDHRMGGQQGGRRASGHRTETQGTPRSATRGMQSTPAPFFEDHMTDELWIALEDFGELSHVAAWCATRCASGGPELGRCARICQDLAEIAALNELLIARDSMFGPEVATTFLRVAEEGLPTLRRFQQRHPHVLETVATIERTMNSCESLLRQVGGGSRSRQGSDARANRSRETRGSRERDRYGRGTSGGPRGGAEMSGPQY